MAPRMCSYTQLGTWTECQNMWHGIYIAKKYQKPGSRAFGMGILAHVAFLEGPDKAQRQLRNPQVAPWCTDATGTTNSYGEKALALGRDVLAAAGDILSGQSEVTVKGMIHRVPWQARVDHLDLQHDPPRFIEFKTKGSRDGKVPTDDYSQTLRRRVHWLWASPYRYDLQIAIQQELIYQQYGVKAVPNVICGAYRKHPDIQRYRIVDDNALLMLLHELREPMQQYAADCASGEVRVRCTHCEWCAQTRTELPSEDLYAPTPTVFVGR